MINQALIIGGNDKENFVGLGFFEKIAQSGASGSQYSLHELLLLVGHSILMGVILCLVTYYTNARSLKKEGKEVSKKARWKFIMGITNILYLCVGLTAIMILVNNNLARAFSIGACIALIRFRVKLGDKRLTSNILFGIIAGIACGLNYLELGWIMVGVYTQLSFSLHLLGKKMVDV